MPLRRQRKAIMEKVEIRVRPVVRHIVTRHTERQTLPVGQKYADGPRSSLETLGEFDNEAQAEQMAAALRNALPKPMKYAIVQRSFDVDVKVYYANEREQAEAYCRELMDHFGVEFRIFARELTDPIAKARAEVTPAGCWQPLGLPPLAVMQQAQPRVEA